jgi:hypothetical protein
MGGPANSVADIPLPPIKLRKIGKVFNKVW